MNEAMQMLAEQIQKASPIVWHAALRQVQIETWELGAYVLIAPIVVGLAIRLAKKQPKDQWGDLEISAVGGYVVAAVLGLAWFPITGLFIEYLANPTFAAIKALKGLL